MKLLKKITIGITLSLLPFLFTPVFAEGNVDAQFDEAYSSATLFGIFPYYGLPGETIYIYGEGFGERTDLSKVGAARICNGAVRFNCDPRYDTGWAFEILEWSDGFIKARLPMAGGEVQQEDVLGTWALIVENNGEVIYYADEAGDRHWFQIVQTPSSIERTFPSGFPDSDYRYLINATHFRFRTERKPTWEEEYNDSVEFKEMVKEKLRIPLREDALWFNVLFNAYEYGGYTIDDVVTEIEHGPCKVHAIIDKDAWEETDTYKNCGM